MAAKAAIVIRHLDGPMLCNTDQFCALRTNVVQYIPCRVEATAARDGHLLEKVATGHSVAATGQIPGPAPRKRRSLCVYELPLMQVLVICVKTPLIYLFNKRCIG